MPLQAQRQDSLAALKLSTRSFEQLTALEDSLEIAEKAQQLRAVLDFHIAKAKSEKDSVELLTTYRLRTWREEFDIALQYADSAVQLGKLLTNKEHLTRSYYTKGFLLYEHIYPEEALDELIKSYNLAVKHKNYELIVDCLNLIAGLKREYGKELESITLLQRALAYLDTYKNDINYFDLTYLITLDNITRGYVQTKELDSALYFVKKAKVLAKQIDDVQGYSELAILEAQTNYYAGNFVTAKDSIVEYLDNFNDLERADILFYLGMIEGELRHNDKKVKYFREYDSIVSSFDYPLIDNVKEVYRYFIKEAVRNKDVGGQEAYLNRLVYFDSLENDLEQKVKLLSFTQFDLPEQEALKKGFKDAISEQVRLKNRLYIGLGILIVVLLVVLARYRVQKRKLDRIMNERVTPVVAKTTNLNTLDLDAAVVEDILLKLSAWEKEQGYLDPEVNQNELAKALNTNSTYLSKIINAYKNQNFANYLKDLRITQAINYLKDNPRYVQNKSSIQLAEEFGFNSLDVFTRALKRKIGITPAVFFKQLKKGNL